MAEYEYYTGYAPVVKEYFDMTADKEREAELIPFLKKLTLEERALIGEAVHTFDRANEVVMNLSSTSIYENVEERAQIQLSEVVKECGYIPRFLFGNNEQQKAFELARYVCFTREQIKGINWYWYTFPGSLEIDRMMEWYMPEWFPDYYREQKAKGNIRLSYDLFLKWRRAGVVDNEPPQEIAHMLIRHFSFTREDKREVPDAITYITQWINEYPEILEEAKYLFQYPTYAIYVDEDSLLREQLGMGPLSYLFKHYSEEGVFDRRWVLKQAALACTNNFSSKEEILWYPELLMDMQPTVDELLSLQNELFTALSCIYPQVTLSLLKPIRTIMNETIFRIDDFMSQLPPLLSSENKSLVKATLAVIAELLKKYPDQRNELCTHLAIIFIHKNEDLQVKVAKWIVKYGEKEPLGTVLPAYCEVMLMAARELLKDFMPHEEVVTGLPVEEETTASLPVTRNENRVPAIETVEELIFRLGQAFEDFRADSIDQIPQALLRFREEINEEVMQQFGPAIKSAEKVLTKWVRGKHHTDEILSFYFLAFCSIRLKQLSQEHPIIKKLKKLFTKLQPEMDSWRDKYGCDDQNVPFTPWIETLNQFLVFAKEGKDLPLLSVPTHEPCWIDPVVFLQRFNRYREENVSPSGMDMQMAIQRLDLTCAEEALKLVGQYSSDFYQEVFLFLFDPQKQLPENVEYPELWLACILPWYEREVPGRLPEEYPDNILPLLTGKFQWETIQQQYTQREYNYDTELYEQVPYMVPRMRFHYDRLPLKELENKHFIGAYMWTPFSFYYHHFTWDMSRLLRIFPNNPETLLARFICEYAQAYEEDYDSVLIPVLEFMRALKRPVLPMGSLYLALCLLYQGKTTRLYAAETWFDLTDAGLADQQEIGRSLGLLLRNGHGPMKRFTDSVYDVMLNRSVKHNRALERLIAACLAQLDEKPLLNLKKLLEAYKELLAQNGSYPNTEELLVLDKWAGQGNLKKLVKEIKEK